MYRRAIISVDGNIVNDIRLCLINNLINKLPIKGREQHWIRSLNHLVNSGKPAIFFAGRNQVSIKFVRLEKSFRTL